uniref:Secreted protein n=1 Tax=Arundo donax TaxID=35708 RepID=A0A0A9FA20_ARUDO
MLLVSTFCTCCALSSSASASFLPISSPTLTLQQDSFSGEAMAIAFTTSQGHCTPLYLPRRQSGGEPHCTKHVLQQDEGPYCHI